MVSNVKLAAVGIIGATMISLGGVGIVSAATQNNTSSNNGNVGSSGIPRSVFKSDVLDSVAKVLNTSTTNVTSAHKDHTFKQLVKNAGLTRRQFLQETKSDLTSELESQGYSSDQVTIALQHREIVHMRHHEKKEKRLANS